MAINFNVQSDRKGSHNGVPWQDLFSDSAAMCCWSGLWGCLRKKIKKKRKKRKNTKHTDVPIAAFLICTISFCRSKANSSLPISPVRVFPCRWGSDVQQAESNFTPKPPLTPLSTLLFVRPQETNATRLLRYATTTFSTRKR